MGAVVYVVHVSRGRLSSVCRWTRHSFFVHPVLGDGALCVLEVVLPGAQGGNSRESIGVNRARYGTVLKIGFGESS